MNGEDNSKLRAAVYQRILTDNIVGIDLQENDTTRWHDEKVKGVPREGSSVVSHHGDIVIATPTLGGISLDEKIIALANVFRLLYHKRRYEVEDTPLWWAWKHGKVTMRIALERMHRWVYSTRPMDVIVLMRYAMTTFYVLADEGAKRKRTDLIFEYDSENIAGILRYRKEREEEAEKMDEEAYSEKTDFANAVRFIRDNPTEFKGDGEICEFEVPTAKEEEEDLARREEDLALRITWKNRNTLLDNRAADRADAQKQLEECKEALTKEKNKPVEIQSESEIDKLNLRIGNLELYLNSLSIRTEGNPDGKPIDPSLSRLATELFVDTEANDNYGEDKRYGQIHPEDPKQAKCR